MQARSVCLRWNFFATAVLHSLLLGVCCCRLTAALCVGSQPPAEGTASHLGPQGSGGGVAQLNASSGLVESGSRHGQKAQGTRSPGHRSPPVRPPGVPKHAWNGGFEGEGALALARGPMREAAGERRRRLGHSLQAATIPRIIHQVCMLLFMAYDVSSFGCTHMFPLGSGHRR